MSANVLRLLLAFALALAVPLQGFAAVAGGICMANEHNDGAPHSHDGDGATQAHDSEQAPDSSAHCPPCVACCAAAAISSPAALIIADTGTDTVSAATPASFAGIQLDTLDRPPLAL